MQSQSEVRNSFKLLVFASLLTMALWFIPFAGLITYPIRLFVTYIHEIGHALAALVTLGGVNRVALDWSGSGVTFTGRLADLERRVFDHDSVWVGPAAVSEASAKCARGGDRDWRYAVTDNGALRGEYRCVVSRTGVWYWVPSAGAQGAAKACPLLHEFSCGAVSAKRFLRSSDCVVPVGV